MDGLAEVVDRFTNAGDGEEEDEGIAVEEIFRTVGMRTYGPLLLVPGLIALSPISGIPGVPTLRGVTGVR